LYVVLGIGIFLKFALWLFCRYINKNINSDMIEALTEDHFNDVVSNITAITTVSIAFYTPAWWMDPAGAILISLVIIFRWCRIIWDQAKKVTGYVAPREYITMVEKMGAEHDARLVIDCTRVYHFGSRYNVEMEIVLPADMTVEESHDIALALQHKLESLKDIERAFVHVDYQKRDGLEHRPERELANSSSNNSPYSPNNATTSRYNQTPMDHLNHVSSMEQS